MLDNLQEDMRQAGSEQVLSAPAIIPSAAICRIGLRVSEPGTVYRGRVNTGSWKSYGTNPITELPSDTFLGLLLQEM